MKKERTNRKDTMKRLLAYAAPYRRYMIAAMVFALLYVSMNLTAPIIIGYALDKAVNQGNVDFSGIANLLLIIAAVVVCSAVFQWLMDLSTNSVAYFTMRDLRRDIYAKFKNK